MTTPFGSGPKAGLRLPSGLTLSTETTAQDPIRSAAVCANTAWGRAAPTTPNEAVARAIVIRGVIIDLLMRRRVFEIPRTAGIVDVSYSFVARSHAKPSLRSIADGPPGAGSERDCH